jgi:hypothetical protein
MKKNSKPRVTLNCPASHYAAPNERIIEYSFPGIDGNPGGLISLWEDSKGRPHISLYRHDAAIKISKGKAG